jgi:tetratricopeptide (TPR) repeat protein
MRRSLRLALLLSLAAPLTARGQAIGPGFELERSGRYGDAANVYLATLRTDPVNIPALLGLERTFFVLSRLNELVPLVKNARARLPENAALRSLELRVWAGLSEGDSLEAAALRWAALVPRSDAPYREWALALADRRQFDDARRALQLGRRALGGEGVLAIELAELEQRAGNWEAAAREWGRAVARSTDAVPNASSQLADAPTAFRDRVLRALTPNDAAPRTRRLASELLLAWGQPAEAWTLFEPTLSRVDVESQTALRRFADLAGTVETPEGHRVRGLALARWGELAPSPMAERARAEAVRELLEGGDRVTARRVLEGLASDSAAPADAQAVAEGALLQVLIADGQLDLVERRLQAGKSSLSSDDLSTLRLALARARVARGELDRAAAALGIDSSVAAVAQHGWIALYKGNLKDAMAAFRMAGPYAGDRAAATDRTAMMALLQRIPEATSPELGAALLMLARGDSVGSVAALRRTAGKFQPQAGRLEILLLAGQIAARLGGQHEVTATAVFDEIVRAGGDGAAPPAAELDWARLLIRQGRNADAVARLEHLILTYPTSAFVPQARRELERARGAIPRS